MYCRLTRQWSYLRRWFLKKYFLQPYFSYYFVFFLLLGIAKNIWHHDLSVSSFHSLAASTAETPITSSGDNFKYRGPQLVYLYLFLLLMFMIIKVINIMMS